MIKEITIENLGIDELVYYCHGLLVLVDKKNPAISHCDFKFDNSDTSIKHILKTRVATQLNVSKYIVLHFYMLKTRYIAVNACANWMSQQAARTIHTRVTRSKKI